MARSRMSSFGGGHGVVVSGIGDHPNRLKTQPRHAYDMRRLAFWLLAMHPRLFNLYSSQAEYRSYLQTNSSLIFLKNFRFKRQYLSVSEFNLPLTATWRPLWGQMAPQSRHRNKNWPPPSHEWMSDDGIQELNCFSNQKIPWVPFRVCVAMPVPALHFSFFTTSPNHFQILSHLSTGKYTYHRHAGCSKTKMVYKITNAFILNPTYYNKHSPTGREPSKH